MTRSYVKSKQLIKEVLEKQNEGKTYREIGELYGLSIKQITNLIYRHRSVIKETSEKGQPPKRRGRPRRSPLTSMSEFECEINRLRMENELLRNFLQNIGRR